MRIFIIRCDGRSGLDDAPTTAIVRARVNNARRASSFGFRWAEDIWPFLRELRRPRRGLDEQVIDVAPGPIFAALEAADDRVMRRMIVLGGVGIGRAVAAADVAARHAQSEMHPLSADLQALFTALGRARRDVMDLIEVFALLRHR